MDYPTILFSEKSNNKFLCSYARFIIEKKSKIGCKSGQIIFRILAIFFLEENTIFSKNSDETTTNGLIGENLRSKIILLEMASASMAMATAAVAIVVIAYFKDWQTWLRILDFVRLISSAGGDWL